MEIWDAHVHCGKSAPWTPKFDPSVSGEEIVKAMDKYGIRKAVIFANPSVGQQYDERNREIANEVEKYSNRLIGFVRVDPRLGDEAVKQLKAAIEDLELKGLKLHPIVECFRPDHPAFDPLFKEAENLGIPILFHSGTGFASPSYIAIVAERHPDLKIILGHLSEACISVMEKHENIYVETSAVVLPSTIAKAIEVDENRVLFGSDYPYLNIRVELTKIEEACEKEKIKRRILAENLKKLISK